MACQRYKESVVEAALGAILPRQQAELDAHLTGCSDCRAALERQRRLLTAIDAGLAAQFAGEPSPEFAARVRQRVDQEQAPANALQGWIAVAAGALALLALVAVWFGRPSATKGPTSGSAHGIQIAPSQGRQASVAQTAPTAEQTAPSGGQVPAHGAARRGPRLTRQLAASSAVPEVLVPAGQQEAVLRLYAALQSGRVDAALLLAPHAPLATAELYIPPLELDELEWQSKLDEPGQAR